MLNRRVVVKSILAQIIDLIYSSREKNTFLDLVFKTHEHDVRGGRPVVLFGAGELGNEMFNCLKKFGIQPAFFCDNNSAKVGRLCSGTRIISFDELVSDHKNSLIVLALGSHSIRDAVLRQLIEAQFSLDNILCKDSDLNGERPFIQMYANSVSMSGRPFISAPHAQESLIEMLSKSENSISKVYEITEDQKSKDLLIHKLALLASGENYSIFKEFITRFSEPFKLYGKDNYTQRAEEFFYFNNDVLKLENDEIYVDIGAADGDTIFTFIEACIKNNIRYKVIHAFEPDPYNFKKMEERYYNNRDIKRYKFGLWSETQQLQFTSSGNSQTNESAAINTEGDITIDVFALDDLKLGKLTFLKMDPSNNVIPQVILGAAGVIKKYKPKLAVGAYHSLLSIVEIPLLINSLVPEYKLYLRHNTCHICDTVLYATID
jgi:FkbM family methyltransferase